MKERWAREGYTTTVFPLQKKSNFKIFGGWVSERYSGAPGAAAGPLCAGSCRGSEGSGRAGRPGVCGCGWWGWSSGWTPSRISDTHEVSPRCVWMCASSCPTSGGSVCRSTGRGRAGCLSVWADGWTGWRSAWTLFHTPGSQTSCPCPCTTSAPRLSCSIWCVLLKETPCSRDSWICAPLNCTAAKIFCRRLGTLVSERRWSSSHWPWSPSGRVDAGSSLPAPHEVSPMPLLWGGVMRPFQDSWNRLCHACWTRQI